MHTSSCVKGAEHASLAGACGCAALATDLPVPILCYDAKGQRRYMNAAAVTMMRAIAGDLSELPSEAELLPAETFQRYRELIREVAATRVPRDIELAFGTSPVEQGKHYYAVQLAPDPTPSDEGGVLAVCFDITAHKHAEARLREREAFLELLLEAIPVPVFSKNREGRYLHLNKAFEDFFGAKKEQLVGKTVFEITDHDLAKIYFDMDEALFRSGGIQKYESKVRNTLKQERNVEFSKAVFHDRQGMAAGLIGAILDITERKRVEEMIARREQDFRTLVENSPDTIARYGRNLRRVYANPTFAKLVEGGQAALIGRKPTECPGGAHTVLYEQKLGEVFESGRGREFELKWIGTDGRKVCNLVKLTPESGSDGTVESVLAVGRDITELHASRKEIHRMAFYDPLTSLPNRALFNERLRQAIAGASVSEGCGGGAAGVMMIDMDRFKGINDTLGHAVGDELLCEAAERLRACVRPFDTVARFGGDEFAILLPDISSRFALEEIAKCIIGRFDERFVLDGKEVFVSCSIGIALYPADGVEADDLMRYADSAMYLAKRSGRRDFCFYSKALTVDATERLLLESELRHAIERGQLELHYQPKVSCAGREVVGAEALLRWKRPGVGFVPPAQFIPVAEESGLIADLGGWVLREACRTAAAWNTGRPAPRKVAVNLSARQFQFHNLAAMVSEILVETGCRPEWLELEITESLLLEEDDAILGTLSVFKSMGLSIAIDDFGTGYSALSYLARFPIDTLKIDRSFVQKVTTDRRHAELVKAILSIAHCLGLQVVAEGVETVEQADFLEANGCRIAQGFLYSKPLPEPEMAALPRRLGTF